MQESSNLPRLLRGLSVFLILLFVFALIPPINAQAAALEEPQVTLNVKNTKTTLSWPQVPGATEYKIYRKFGTGGTYQQIGSTKGTQFTDIYHNTVPADHKNLYKYSKATPDYYIDPTKNNMIYSVQAVSGLGSSDYQNTGLFNLQTPTVLSVSEKDDKATIRWKTVGNAATYDICYGKADSNGKLSWVRVKSVPATDANSMSTEIKMRSGYKYYTVQAKCPLGGKVLTSGNSGYLRTNARNHTKSKILFLGDSLCYSEPYPSTVGFRASYPYRVAQNTGAYVYNAGISGATLAIHDGVYSIYQDEVLKLDQGQTPRHPKSSVMTDTKYKLEDFDIVVLEGGANDYGRSVPLGTFGDMNTKTFYGAYSSLLKVINKASHRRMQAGKGKIKVVLVGMFYSGRYTKDPVNPRSKYEVKNSQGLTYNDYENAIRKEYNEWQGSKYIKVRLYDPCKYTYLTKDNCSYNTVDDLHMTAYTYAKIGDTLTSFLRNEVWK